MNRMLLAGVFAATAALCLPAFAQAPASPQAAPAPPAAAAAEPAQPPGGEEMERGRMMMRGGEAGGMRAMMMRQMMMRHGMWRSEAEWNPQQRCVDRLAWRAARRAYVESKLDLTPQQRPLWDRVQTIAQTEDQKERQLCRQLTPAPEATVLERIDRAQQFLSARLDALQAAKPAVQALYQALSPEQREVFDHPFRS